GFIRRSSIRIFRVGLEMPTDRTPYFRAHVKTLISQGIEENGAGKPDHPSVSLAYKKMAAHAFTLGKDLAEFRQVVLNRRRDYLSFNSPTPTMNESERDEFDRDTEKALSQFGLAIRRFSSQTAGDLLTAKEEKKHLSVVADLLSTQLKRIAKIVTDMRALRVRNAAQQQKVQRLYNLVEAKQKRDKEKQANNPEMVFARSFSPDIQFRRRGHHDAQKGVNLAAESVLPYDKPDGVSHDGWDLGAATLDLEQKHNEEELDSSLTPQERTQLMAENETLYERYTHMHSQIEGLETQISEIQRLQETFAEKIMDQEKDIEIINEAALHTSENLKDGNEWIRQAISNSAGRRVVVLFCIIVITFTLLFLDWYNP
ncbi:hypothetical protein V3C99_014288, partial [Haemonchus contortus]